MANDPRTIEQTRSPRSPSIGEPPQIRRWRMQFRIVGVARRAIQELVDADGVPRRGGDERERSERFMCFAELLRGVKSSVRVIRADGSELYLPPKVCCTAAAVLVYLASLERGSCLAWMEWERFADLRGVEYNSAYKQISEFTRIMNRKCGITEGPFEYPRGSRGAVRFMVAGFDVEFCR